MVECGKSAERQRQEVATCVPQSTAYSIGRLSKRGIPFSFHFCVVVLFFFFAQTQLHTATNYLLIEY